MPILQDHEVRAQYVEAMGSDLGDLCHELRNDLTWLQQKWSEFRELFGHGPERIELLNSVSSSFVYFLHVLMFEDAMLHLARLTDSSNTFGRSDRANLTVMRLPESISEPALKNHVEAAVELARKK